MAQGPFLLMWHSNYLPDTAGLLSFTVKKTIHPAVNIYRGLSSAVPVQGSNALWDVLDPTELVEVVDHSGASTCHIIGF